jgi:hypothetical protein
MIGAIARKKAAINTKSKKPKIGFNRGIGCVCLKVLQRFLGD